MRNRTRGIRFPRLYDLLIRFITSWRERDYRADLVRLAEVQSGMNVLDIGCGTGSFTTEVWRKIQPGGLVFGVDVSNEMLEVARNKNKKKSSQAIFLNADASALPFQNDEFDVVTMITAMHAIPKSDISVAIMEMLRVLKPEGIFLVVDFAGDLEKRKHWISLKGAHAEFDIHHLPMKLKDFDTSILCSGNINWMDLGYIKAAKIVK